MQKQAMSFEDLVLRSTYMVKTVDKDISSKLITYDKNIEITAQVLMNKYQFIFERVGYSYDDVLGLAKIYAYYFFNIYADNLTKTTPNYERNGLITFIKQRMSFVVNICERQSANFHADKRFYGFYAKTPKTKMHDVECINEDPTKLGYRKVSIAELRRIRGNKNRTKMQDDNGFDVVFVNFFNNLSPDDYVNILNNGYDYSMDWEANQHEREYQEEQSEINTLIDNFYCQTPENQLKYLKYLLKSESSETKREQIKKLVKIVRNRIKYAKSASLV